MHHVTRLKMHEQAFYIFNLYCGVITLMHTLVAIQMLRFDRYLLIALATLFGCKNANDTKTLHTPAPSPWIYVIVNANSNEFLVSRYDDTLTIKKIFTEKTDSIQKVKISKDEKDSLFKWTETLIQTKPEPTAFCTDYYGKLTLKIIYSEQVSKQAQFTSICEWQNLDSNTSHIYKLVTEKSREK